MSNKNVKMYVITHSPDDIINIESDEMYTPLFVGRDGKDNLGFTSDDSGDNISSRNPDYCELTGLYWMWKNSNADILGLCHYRRYFKNKGHKIKKGEIEEYLKDYDIILPKKKELIKKSLFENYKGTYFIDVLNTTREIIKEKYPDYLKDYDKVIHGSSFSNFNMFIMSKELMDKYCDWLFNIIIELENRINLQTIPRILGLISESILNVWVEHNKLKVKGLDIKYIGTFLNFRMALTNNRILVGIYRFLYFKVLDEEKRVKLGHFIDGLFFNKLIK
ncbi:DUF4422 domain-containing protein [Methanobrevibacter boviskoreani]|uniref:DUF4422 domain-containing protein n=1 Tax=Methanobrevibacter boviskoreani TaxID=1348249 RepID=UPI0023A854F8|nr:DUF4422 domain-containing protein [Methanobrevibacter boviskoreani]MCI6930956.1 DUF4422 domain-containing protein [Methanobrevibacter boviskoreani]MDD6257247.1 DUF4422 domain-containing protein [Methanobrevibacter boviskoreani]